MCCNSYILPLAACKASIPKARFQFYFVRLDRSRPRQKRVGLELDGAAPSQTKRQQLLGVQASAATRLRNSAEKERVAGLLWTKLGMANRQSATSRPRNHNSDNISNSSNNHSNRRNRNTIHNNHSIILM